MLATPVLLLALLTPADDFAPHFDRRDLGKLMQSWHDQSPTRLADRKRLTLLALDDVRITERDNRIEVRDAKGALLEQYDLVVKDDRVWSLTMTAPATPLETAREQIYRGIDLLDSGDLQAADAAFTRAWESAEASGHAPTRAAAQRGLGNVAVTRGDIPSAARHFENAHTISRTARDRHGEGRALVQLATADRFTGNLQRAEARLREALQIFRDDKHELLAGHALMGLGAVLLSQGNFNDAHAQLTAAITIFEERGDVAGLADALSGLGVNWRARGSYREATELLRRALELYRLTGNDLGVGNTYGNLGVTQAMQGQYAEAVAAFRDALAIHERLGRVQAIMVTLANTAEMYRTLGDYEQARELFQRAAAMAEKFGFKPGMAAALHNLGQVRVAQDDPAGAIPLYEKSLAIEQEIGNRYAIGRSLHNLGRAHFYAGEHATARGFFEKSLAIAREIQHRESIALSLGLLTEVAATPEEAIGHSREMLAIAESLDTPELQMWAQHAHGLALRRAGRLAEARVEIERSINTAERLRRGVPGQEVEQQQAFSNMVRPFHEMVGILVELGDAASALEYAERGKARTLLDVLRHGRPDIGTALTDAERARESALAAQLADVNRDYRRALISGKVGTDLQTKLRKARLEYEAFFDGVFAAHPQLRMERGDVVAARLADAKALLAAGVADAFLEFVVTGENTYLFAITNRGVRAYTIDMGRLAIQREVLRYRELLASHDLTYAAAARSLYERLLAPAAAQLRGKRTICIVPDGALWELPFQTLQPSAAEFLLDRHAIYYAPSLTVLREMSRATVPRAREARLIAFGNPVMPSETPGRATRTRRDASLAPLPHTETEIRNIASLYGARNSRIHLRSEAREEVVKAEAGRYDVLHFATHGVLDDQNALYSRLVFSPSRTPGEDGLLEAREIMRLDLRARLAVLSACETARGRVGAGEGLIGLSWALFLAGVPTSVVSQWSVDSESTAALMFEFHRNLRASGRSAAEALRLAALATRAKREYRHPFYWAPFVVVGNGR